MKTKRRRGPVALLACAAVWSLACSREAPPQGAGGSESGASDVSSFLSEANDTLLRLGIESNQAGWVQQTYITQDTEALSARADQAYVSAVTEYSKQAARMESGSAAPSRGQTPPSADNSAFTLGTTGSRSSTGAARRASRSSMAERS